jgi:hypothetical protein
METQKPLLARRRRSFEELIESKRVFFVSDEDGDIVVIDDVVQNLVSPATSVQFVAKNVLWKI